MLSCDFMGLKGFIGIFANKVAQNWFVLHETWHITIFSICDCVEVVRIENHSHVLKLRVKLRFYRSLSFFYTFAHKVAQNWFVF